jgi:hypothetical protein
VPGRPPFPRIAVVTRFVALVALLTASAAGAAETRVAASAEEAIPWAYSAYFGTGAYELEGGQETYVLRFEGRWTRREAGIDEHGERTVGLEFRLPVSLGVHTWDLADIGSTLKLENVSTITAVPGVEIDIPIGPRWSIKPFGFVGWGTELDGDVSSWVYWTGVKSRWRFPGEKLDWALLNSLTYAGYQDSASDHSSVLPLFTALEFDKQLAHTKLRGEPVRLHWHVGYTEYLNDVELFQSNLRTVDVRNEWDIGMAFGTGDAVRLWRLHWNRIGLAYRFSSDHEFKGISLFFRALYDR